MSTVHKMERALVGKGIDGVLHYVNRDPEDRKKALLNLIFPTSILLVRKSLLVLVPS